MSHFTVCCLLLFSVAPRRRMSATSCSSCCTSSEDSDHKQSCCVLFIIYYYFLTLYRNLTFVQRWPHLFIKKSLIPMIVIRTNKRNCFFKTQKSRIIKSGCSESIRGAFVRGALQLLQLFMICPVHQSALFPRGSLLDSWLHIGT